MEGLQGLALLTPPHTAEKLAHRYAVRLVAILSGDINSDHVES